MTIPNLAEFDAIREWDANNCRPHVIHAALHVKSLLPSSIKAMIDIGSNVGKFYDCLIEAGVTIQKCWMFEANVDLAYYSRLKYKSVPSVRVVNLAVSSTDGLVSFNTQSPYVKRGESYNMGLGSIDTHGRLDSMVVPVLKPSTWLTEEMFSSVEFIKIDTETVDLDIVEDILNVIDRFETKPVIIFEKNWIRNSPRFTVTSPQQILNRYTDHGYLVPQDVDSERGDIVLVPTHKTQ